jgi:hypothetical protein
MVLGVHRSGTSAFARVASLLGCALPKELMAPSEGNTIGHWESNIVTALNDELLASAGSRWDDWLSLGEDWSGSVLRDEFLDRAAEVLRQEYGQSSLFVLKDPRICRLAPLWLEALTVLNVHAVVAIPVRNPIEVAESLSARDGSAPGHGLLVWLRNVLDAEFASRGLPRHVFSYDDLLDDWSSVVEKMEKATAILWPRKSVLTSLEIDAFLTHSARHQDFNSKIALGSRTPTWVRDTYAILTKWCAHGEDSEDHARLDRIRAGFDASAPTFAQLITQGTVRGDGVGEADRKRQQLEADVARLSQELLEAGRGNEATSQGFEAAEQATALMRNDRADLERQLTEAIANRDIAISLQDAAVTERERLVAEIEQMQNDQSAEKARDSEYSETISILNSEVDGLRHQLATVSQSVVAHEENLARLRDQADKTIGDLRNQLSETESALLQRQEEARQTWADLTVEQRTNELLRGELDRAHARQAALERLATQTDRRLHDQAEAVLAAETRVLEAAWAAKEAALLETHAQNMIARQKAELDSLAQDRHDDRHRLARYGSEVAQLIGFQIELESALLAAEERGQNAERLSAAAAMPLPVAIHEEQPVSPLTDHLMETVSDAALTQRQHDEIAQLTLMAPGEAQPLSQLQDRAEWLRDFSNLQQRTPRWWALLPANERARRLRTKVEAKGMFDVAAYLSKYPDVSQSGMDPLMHYVRHGVFEGRSW